MSNLVTQTSDEILRLMNAKRISQADLAKRLGVTEARVSQLLDQSNLTLRSVERIFTAIDAAPLLTAIPF